MRSNSTLAGSSAGFRGSNPRTVLELCAAGDVKCSDKTNRRPAPTRPRLSR